jgi:hypothetical protein
MPACVQPARPSLFLQDCGELTLRVHGSGHDGRLIRIRSPKCTIGSAAGCTLRLVAAGVAPLHCWVLRGKEATIVRKLHGPVALNGGALCESALAPGDRLQVGTVELEVVECNRPSPPAAPELFAIPPVDTAELERELAAAMERITRLEAESRQGWQSSITAAERADQLRTALADAHHQLDDACRELAAAQATMQRQSAELQELRGALTATEQAGDERAELLDRMQLESAAFRDEQGRLLAELNEARTALSAAIDERSRQAALAAEHQERLATEQQRWQEEMTLLERRLKQRDAELAAVREESNAQTNVMTIAMTQLRHNVDASQEQGQARIRELEKQLEASRAELARVQQEWTSQQAEQNQRANEQSAAAERELGHLREQLAEREQHLAAASSRLDEGARAAARCDELQGQLLAAQQNLQSANEQLAALAASARDESARQQEELARQQAALAERQSALAAREASIAARQAETDQLHERLEQQSAELERNLESATRRVAELDALRAQLAAERDALAQRELSATHLTEPTTRLTEPTTRLTEPGTHLTEATPPVSVDLQSRLDASEARNGQLASQVEALQLRCRELEEQRQTAIARAAAAYSDAAAEMSAQQSIAPAVSAPSEGEAASPNLTVALPPAGEATISFPVTAPASVKQGTSPRDTASVVSVLGRLVRSGVRRSSVARPTPAAAAEPAPPAAAEPTPPAAAEPTLPAPPAPCEPPVSNTAIAVVPAEDESIDKYMDRLLKRVRGETVSDAGSWKLQPVAPAAPAESPPLAPAPVLVEGVLEPAGEYLPRTAAPEQSLGLSAMRDLANTAARDAIDIHIRKHTGRQAVSRLVTAALIITASVILGYWAWRVRSLSAGIGAGVGGIAGVLWTLAALQRIANVIRLNRARPQTAPFPTAGAP